MSVIPLGDASRRPTRWPAVTALIVLTDIVVFGLELAGGQPFVTRWAVTPEQVSSGHNLITVLTAMFLHAGWSHIVGNMIFLWAFGPEVEDAMGPIRYALFYVVGGVAAMAAQVLADPHSTVPNLGASGAIAAVMGAFIVLYPRDQIRTLLIIFVFVRTRFIPAALFIGLWFLTQLVSIGTVAQVQTGGVAYMAHVGGFVYGAVMSRLLKTTGRVSPAGAAT